MMQTRENISEVKRAFLWLVLALLVSSHFLTWYGVTILGLEEGNPSVARLIQTYGAPTGLFINYIIWLALILPLWFLWQRFPFAFKRRQKWRTAVNLIFTFLFTYTFMWLFWSVFFDFANDVAMVAFRSKLFFPLLEGTAQALFTISIFALIAAAIFSKFGPSLRGRRS
jgi:hypothetical protein